MCECSHLRALCAAQYGAAPDALSCRAQTEGTPANVLATLANNLLGVQQAFAKEGTSTQSLQHTTGDKSAAHYDMGAPQVDPIPKVCEHSGLAASTRGRGQGQGQGRQRLCIAVCAVCSRPCFRDHAACSLAWQALHVALWQAAPRSQSFSA